jgi:hypothetical protein
LGEKSKKQWYLVGVLGTAVCVVICCLLDNLRYSDFEDNFFNCLVIAMPLCCAWTVISGVRWGRVGTRNHIIGFALFGLCLPFLLGGFLSLFGFPPNVHGYGFTGLMFAELSFLITAIAMIVAICVPKKAFEKLD